MEERKQSQEIDQENFVKFADMIEELQERITDTKAEIEEHFVGFMKENDIEKKEKKHLKSSIKKYLKWKKDQVTFNEAETIENKYLDILTGEKCIKHTDGTFTEI